MASYVRSYNDKLGHDPSAAQMKAWKALSTDVHGGCSGPPQIDAPVLRDMVIIPPLMHNIGRVIQIVVQLWFDCFSDHHTPEVGKFRALIYSAIGMQTKGQITGSVETLRKLVFKMLVVFDAPTRERFADRPKLLMYHNILRVTVLLVSASYSEGGYVGAPCRRLRLWVYGFTDWFLMARLARVHIIFRDNKPPKAKKAAGKGKGKKKGKKSADQRQAEKREEELAWRELAAGEVLVYTEEGLSSDALEHVSHTRLVVYLDGASHLFCCTDQCTCKTPASIHPLLRCDSLALFRDCLKSVSSARSTSCVTLSTCTGRHLLLTLHS